MRLQPQQIGTIRDEARAVFGPEVAVRLFGSRVDDAARGGDIDLLISSAQPVERPARLAVDLAARLQMALGEQRIDVLVEAPNLLRQPIHEIARAQGVLL